MPTNPTPYGPPTRAQAIAAERRARFMAELDADAPDDAAHPGRIGRSVAEFAERERERMDAYVGEIARNLAPDPEPPPVVTTYRAVPCQCGDQRYPGVQEAADASGLSVVNVWENCQRKRDGWRWCDCKRYWRKDRTSCMHNGTPYPSVYAAAKALGKSCCYVRVRVDLCFDGFAPAPRAFWIPPKVVEPQPVAPAPTPMPLPQRVPIFRSRGNRVPGETLLADYRGGLSIQAIATKYGLCRTPLQRFMHAFTTPEERRELSRRVLSASMSRRWSNGVLDGPGRPQPWDRIRAKSRSVAA